MKWKKKFQYRKRYGLHAIIPASIFEGGYYRRFNTASGMDCMQYVWFLILKGAFTKFQYRKRYGLHAILSMTTSL